MKQLDLYTDGSYTSSELLTEEMLPIGYDERLYSSNVGKAGLVTHGGFIVIDHDTEEPIHLHRIHCTRPSFVQSRNIGGEIIAAGLGFKWCVYYISQLQQLGDKEKYKVAIYHDYIGISEWIKPHYKKKWNAESPCSRIYVGLMENALVQGNCILEFVKVKAHSGNKWNEVADAIAGGYPVDLDMNVEITNI